MGKILKGKRRRKNGPVSAKCGINKVFTMFAPKSGHYYSNLFKLGRGGAFLVSSNIYTFVAKVVV
jgi:hypothetical protein